MLLLCVCGVSVFLGVACVCSGAQGSEGGGVARASWCVVSGSSGVSGCSASSTGPPIVVLINCVFFIVFVAVRVFCTSFCFVYSRNSCI